MHHTPSQVVKAQSAYQLTKPALVIKMDSLCGAIWRYYYPQVVSRTLNPNPNLALALALALTLTLAFTRTLALCGAIWRYYYPQVVGRTLNPNPNPPPSPSSYPNPRPYSHSHALWRHLALLLPASGE